MLFYPRNSPKNQQNLKNMKKNHLEISSFYTSVPKIMIICYPVLEIWRVTDVIIFFSFWAIFYPLPSPLPLTAKKNQNFEKMKKTLGGIIILHMTPKIIIRSCMVPETWCTTADKQIYRWKKWHIEVGAKPNTGKISCSFWD